MTTEGKTSPRAPTDLDHTIADNIRRLRRHRKLIQADLARHLGVSLAQVQKYEQATNRIPASRLFRLAQLFDTPMDTFLEKVEHDASVSSGLGE